jgi:hypothetical protein
LIEKAKLDPLEEFKLSLLGKKLKELYEFEEFYLLVES